MKVVAFFTVFILLEISSALKNSNAVPHRLIWWDLNPNPENQATVVQEVRSASDKREELDAGWPQPISLSEELKTGKVKGHGLTRMIRSTQNQAADSSRRFGTSRAQPNTRATQQSNGRVTIEIEASGLNMSRGSSRPSDAGEFLPQNVYASRDFLTIASRLSGVQNEISSMRLATLEELTRLKELILLQGAIHIRVTERQESMLVAQYRLISKLAEDSQRLMNEVKRSCECRQVTGGVLQTQPPHILFGRPSDSLVSSGNGYVQDTPSRHNILDNLPIPDVATTGKPTAARSTTTRNAPFMPLGEDSHANRYEHSPYDEHMGAPDSLVNINSTVQRTSMREGSKSLVFGAKVERFVNSPERGRNETQSEDKEKVETGEDDAREEDSSENKDGEKDRKAENNIEGKASSENDSDDEDSSEENEEDNVHLSDEVAIYSVRNGSAAEESSDKKTDDARVNDRPLTDSTNRTRLSLNASVVSVDEEKNTSIAISNAADARGRSEAITSDDDTKINRIIEETIGGGEETISDYNSENARVGNKTKLKVSEVTEFYVQSTASNPNLTTPSVTTTNPRNDNNSSTTVNVLTGLTMSTDRASEIYDSSRSGSLTKTENSTSYLHSGTENLLRGTVDAHHGTKDGTEASKFKPNKDSDIFRNVDSVADLVNLATRNATVLMENGVELSEPVKSTNYTQNIHLSRGESFLNTDTVPIGLPPFYRSSANNVNSTYVALNTTPTQSVRTIPFNSTTLNSTSSASVRSVPSNVTSRNSTSTQYAKTFPSNTTMSILPTRSSLITPVAVHPTFRFNGTRRQTTLSRATPAARLLTSTTPRMRTNTKGYATYSNQDDDRKEKESYDLDVDLTTGTIKGDNAPGVTFISSLSPPVKYFALEGKAESGTIDRNCSMQGVVKFTFMPRRQGRRGDRRELLLDMWFRNPQGWVFNLGDSVANNGYSGDGAVQQNDCEAQGFGSTFSVYASDKHTNAREKLLRSMKLFLFDKLTLIVSDKKIVWNNHRGNADSLTNPSLFALSGQPDNQGKVNYDVFLGLNRVIDGNYRIGHGLCRMSARWLT